MIKSKPCKVCASTWHTAMYHKPAKPLKRTPLPRSQKPIKTYKRPNRQSDKEKTYQVWKETEARPFLVLRDGNICQCCKRPAYPNEKLDIEHEQGKGSHPERKRDLTNLRLFCRFCHHFKTIDKPCQHPTAPLSLVSPRGFEASR